MWYAARTVFLMYTVSVWVQTYRTIAKYFKHHKIVFTVNGAEEIILQKTYSHTCT